MATHSCTYLGRRSLQSLGSQIVGHDWVTSLSLHFLYQLSYKGSDVLWKSLSHVLLLDYTVHGILQAGILEWVAFSFSRRSSQLRDRNCLLHLLHWQAGSSLIHLQLIPSFANKCLITVSLCGLSTWKKNLLISLTQTFRLKMKVRVTQSCPTLCDPMDYTLHGILQARILKWVAFPFSRGSSQPRDQTQVSHIAGRFFTSWAAREAQEYWSG